MKLSRDQRRVIRQASSIPRGYRILKTDRITHVDVTTAKQYQMRDDQFEWLDAKAARNWRDHDISFEMARDVFKDIFAIEWADHGQDEGEDRFVTVGMTEDRLLFVSYTFRGDRIRIISARLAEPYERRRYHNEKQA
jgi:uncharacterized protein